MAWTTRLRKADTGDAPPASLMFFYPNIKEKYFCGFNFDCFRGDILN